MRISADSLPSPAWCIVPWVHLFADESGQMRPCCMTLENPEAVVRDDQGNAVTVHEGGIEAGWNSRFMKSLRLGMLAGERAPICSRCFRDEDIGIRSYRQMSNDMFASQAEEALRRTASDGASDPDLIRSFDIRLGNLCNLRCRMCSPQSSKALINEFAGVLGISREHPALVQLREMNWQSSREFWGAMEKLIPSIERLHFAGGEPLLIAEMIDFLERIVESGRAAQVTLSYVTNCTILPQRALDLWPYFKRLAISASLDGIADLNSYIRHPARWDAVDRNLHLLDAEAEHLHCADGLHLNTTVQIYNIFHLDAVLEYAATSFRWMGRPKLSLLYYPEHFSIRVLPRELKELAASRLLGFVERFETRWPERWRGGALNDLLATVRGIVRHMFEADRTDLLPEFHRWNDFMDAARGHRAQDVIPELAPLFEVEQVGHGR